MVDANSDLSPDLLKVSILGSESIHVGCESLMGQFSRLQSVEISWIMPSPPHTLLCPQNPLDPPIVHLCDRNRHMYRSIAFAGCREGIPEADCRGTG